MKSPFTPWKYMKWMEISGYLWRIYFQILNEISGYHPQITWPTKLSSLLPLFLHTLFFPLDMAAKLMRAVRYSGYGGGAAGLEVLFSPPPEFCFFLVGFPFFLFYLVFIFWSFCWFYFYFWVLCDLEAEKRDCEVGLIFFVIESIRFIMFFILFYFIFYYSSSDFFLPTCFKYKKKRAFDFILFYLFIFSPQAILSFVGFHFVSNFLSWFYRGFILYVVGLECVPFFFLVMICIPLHFCLIPFTFSWYSVILYSHLFHVKRGNCWVWMMTTLFLYHFLILYKGII